MSLNPQETCVHAGRWKKENPQNQGFILQKFKKGIEIAIAVGSGQKDGVRTS